MITPKGEAMTLEDARYWVGDSCDILRSNGNTMHAEKLEQVLALLTPRPEASAWRDIATAPKDGTVIDVWLGDANEDEIEFYCTPGTRRSAAWSWKGDKFRPFGGLTWMQTTFVQPTHWQPLPSPPTEAG